MGRRRGETRGVMRGERAPNRASDDDVASWREQGWALLEGLIDPATIDAALEDVHRVLPTAAEYHADPRRVTEQYLGVPPPSRDRFRWPPEGPGFRPEQHRWGAEFPFPGGRLNRLCVHPAIVDFVVRALDTKEIRLYQAQVNAKYTGAANYEQPLHTDRNHSWLPAHPDAEWWHVETFVYLSDVDRRHRADAPRSAGRDAPRPVDDAVPPARRAPRRLRRRTTGAWPAWLGPRLPHRRVPPRRRPDRAERRAVPVERELQGREPRMDRLHRDPTARDRPQLREVRGALDTARARAARLPGTRPRNLDARAPRPHRAALPRAGSHAVAERTR